MSGNKQRRFTDEFKRGAVRLTRTSGRRVERVANDFGIAKIDVESVAIRARAGRFARGSA